MPAAEVMIWIDKARISAAMAIVVLHSAILVQSANLLGSGYWWSGNIYNSLVRWAIPVFVMISGALLLDPGKNEPFGLFYRKRIARIFIPLLAWSAIYLCLDYFYAATYGIQISKQQIFLNLLEGKPHFHLWFLYMIIGLYLFTPFFRLIIRNTSHKDLQILVLIMFLISAFSFLYTELIPGVPPLFITKFIPFIPYYFLGYLIRSTQYKPSKITLLVIFFCSGVITATGYYFSAQIRHVSSGIYFYGYFSFAVIIMAACILMWFRYYHIKTCNSGTIHQIAQLTLGIYLIHPIFLKLINLKGWGISIMNPALSIPLTAIAVFCLSLASSWLIKQVPVLKRII